MVEESIKADPEMKMTKKIEDNSEILTENFLV